MFAFLLKRLSPETEWHDLPAEKQKYVKGILWGLIMQILNVLIGSAICIYLAYLGAVYVVLLPIAVSVLLFPKTMQTYRDKIHKILARKNAPLP